ncbi:MAG: hypothetical protein OSJ64_02550 [Firmicutes bacterium]|jgi:hypothetical protein|nr:hypothetical protein [Bacillota bacterium]
MMILQRLARLLDVKSLVTLALVLVLCIMTLSGREVSELFSSAVMLVLGFFFGKNVQRDNISVDLDKNQADSYLGGK